LAELRVSGSPGDRLVTHALGSCLGIAVYDPVARVGGLLHAVLPLSTADPEKASRQPLAFVDLAVPALFRACYRRGARKPRMRVTVAGGATTTHDDDADGFQIGKRNLVVLRRLLWNNGVLIRAQHVGGVRIWRTMMIDIATGRVTLKTHGAERVLDPGMEEWT
jgi:chemotaxis protein CheD